MVQLLCKSLELVNEKVFKDFSSGERLEHCLDSISELLAPSVTCLAIRALRKAVDGGSPVDLPEFRVMTAVRDQWCALLAVELPQEFKKELPGIIGALMHDSGQHSSPSLKSHKNIDLIDQGDDLKLADRYAQATALLQA